MSLDESLIGHWPLRDDCADHGPAGHEGVARGVELGQVDGQPAGVFAGRAASIHLPRVGRRLASGGAFSIGLWVHTGETTDVVGDLVSCFDPAQRRGFNLSLMTHTGVTSTSTSGRRQLTFGIDDAVEDDGWQDCGRPGRGVLATAMIVCGGYLYAGVTEAAADGVGQVYRYAGGRRWVQVGENPVGCNSILSLAEHDGELYAGTARYKLRGSRMAESLNERAGGRVFRIDAAGQWHDCGIPGLEGATPESEETGGAFHSNKADAPCGLTVHEGDLYCGLMYRKGVYRYEGGDAWKPVGLDHRIFGLATYRHRLYALTNGGSLCRYEGGDRWADLGTPPGTSQIYSAVISRGRLLLGTWPRAAVWAYDPDGPWQSVAAMSTSTEIMGMASYNGKVYVGELPMGNVFRIDGAGEPEAGVGLGGHMTWMGNVEDAPAIMRRVWAMAVYRGRLHVSTLPSGRIRSFGAGAVATHDHTFPGGWHHVCAVKSEGELRLVVDGEHAGASSPFGAEDYSLAADAPLVIGAGEHEHFEGEMADIRLYDRALDLDTIRALARTRPSEVRDGITP